MTAATGSDASPPVEYFFDEISGNTGGTDSGWWSYSWNDYELGFCTLKATATDDKGNIKNSIVVVEIVE